MTILGTLRAVLSAITRYRQPSGIVTAPPDLVTLDATFHRTVTAECFFQRIRTCEPTFHRTVTVDTER